MTKRPTRPPQDPNRFWLWGIHACKSALKNPQRKCFRLVLTDSTLKDLDLKKEELPHKMDMMDSSTLSRLLPEGAVHQGVAMEVAPLPESSLDDLRALNAGVLVVLD